MGFLMHHSTRPQTSHCLHYSQIVTEDDYGKGAKKKFEKKTNKC